MKVGLILFFDGKVYFMEDFRINRLTHLILTQNKRSSGSEQTISKGVRGS